MPIRKPDWMEMERRIRAALREYTAGRLLGTQACRVIDEAVAAATGRGNELPHDGLEWESEQEIAETAVTRNGFW